MHDKATKSWFLASFQALLPRRSKEKGRESLVYFDHVLDVVGRGFGVAVHFAYARTLSLYAALNELYHSMPSWQVLL